MGSQSHCKICKEFISPGICVKEPCDGCKLCTNRLCSWCENMLKINWTLDGNLDSLKRSMDDFCEEFRIIKPKPWYMCNAQELIDQFSIKSVSRNSFQPMFVRPHDKAFLMLEQILDLKALGSNLTVEKVHTGIQYKSK